MIQLKAYAKVNLFINVLHRREDGYHHLEMMNAKVDLYDLITLSENSKPGMVLIKSNDMFLSNQNNVVFDTASYMMHQYVEEKGVTIDIQKNIPFGAGLAGNSTDAATIIKGINQLFSLKLSFEEMRDIGLLFGADIPYCLIDDFAFVEGIGEKITPINFKFKNKQLLLVNPKVYLETKEIFHQGDKYGFENVDATEIKKAAKEQNLEMFIEKMHNALQKISVSSNEEVRLLYETMRRELGPKGLVMTGSGSTFIKIIDSSDASVTSFIDKYSEKYFMNIYNFL